MATDREVTLEDSGFDDPAFEQEDAPEEVLVDTELPTGEAAALTYAVHDRPLEEQVKRATWHMRKVAQAERRMALLLGPVVAEIQRAEDAIDRLRRTRKQIVHQGEAQSSWHRAKLEEWAELPETREALGKTVKLAFGRVVTRQGKGTTRVDEEVLADLYEADHEGYADLYEWELQKGAAHKRFTLREDGTTLDTATGEVLPVAVIVQVEAPSVRAYVEPDIAALAEEQ
jgi:hypothetical protein